MGGVHCFVRAGRAFRFCCFGIMALGDAGGVIMVFSVVFIRFVYVVCVGSCSLCYSWDSFSLLTDCWLMSFLGALVGVIGEVQPKNQSLGNPICQPCQRLEPLPPCYVFRLGGIMDFAKRIALEKVDKVDKVDKLLFGCLALVLEQSWGRVQSLGVDLVRFLVCVGSYLSWSWVRFWLLR